MLRGRRWDWASRGEQRSLLATFGSQAGGSMDWRAPNRDRKIHIGIDIHLLIAGRGPRRKSSRMPGRDQALPFGPQEAIPLQSHTSPRYKVSSHTRAFINLTLPSPTFQNSACLRWTLTWMPLLPFCRVSGQLLCCQQVWGPPTPEHPSTELGCVLYSQPSAARQPQAPPSTEPDSSIFLHALSLGQLGLEPSPHLGCACLGWVGGGG